MKAYIHIAKFFGLGVILAVAFLTAGCAAGRSRSSETSGALGLRQITSVEEEQSLNPGDSVAMVCTRCNSVVYLNLARPSQAALNPLGENHPCPECKATIKRVRVGKTHQLKITHVCEKCAVGILNQSSG